MIMTLGGHASELDGSRRQLEVLVDPGEDIILGVLSSIFERSGVVVMRRQIECETQPYELVLYVEDGNFLLMLNEFDSEGETNVRTLSNDKNDGKLFSILGECYPAAAVTRDKELVCDIFIKFSREGNLPIHLMR